MRWTIEGGIVFEVSFNSGHELVQEMIHASEVEAAAQAAEKAGGLSRRAPKDAWLAGQSRGR